MPDIFNVLFLGNLTDIDTVDGDNDAENASALVGMTFGGESDALAARVQEFSPGSTGYTGGTNTAYDQDNTPAETFRLDGGAEQTFDSAVVYNATITYIDGTTSNITAVVFQDTDGNTYLAPEFSANADQAALEAAPIRSLTLDSLLSNEFSGMTGSRQTTNYVTCFTDDVMITTPAGELPVQHLSVGDLVRTQDNGMQPIRWIGRAQTRAAGAMTPVCISAGALGGGVPRTDLMVSQQHRILIRSKIVRRMTGASEVFVAAKTLLALDGVTLALTAENVTYHHLLLDHHEVIFANGMPTESLMTGKQALYAVGLGSVLEIMTLFPGLIHTAGQPARPIVKGPKIANLIARHVKNGVPLHAA